MVVLHDQRVGELHAEAQAQLASWEWPGNVRELENVMERAVITAGSQEIIEEDDLLLGLEVGTTSLPADLPEDSAPPRRPELTGLEFSGHRHR